ncbi:hypothetical protein JX265_003254 [Neoarthrinium moseri]|uniref:Allantoin permease n=1 Tax=Neoarthrinium moseri TaxID=1658444 RepID=A0A9P9WTI2_9PEZI|nr:hypothetical protein JX265_003254 [Neoarthrinium moseri]
MSSTLLSRIQLEHGSMWINDDIRPLELGRRTWGFMTFHNFWLLINCSIATYLTGSALIPLGLTWWQAIICIVIGNIIATAALLVSSLAGAYYNIGFSVYSRTVWGVWGSQFVIWNRMFLSLVWSVLPVSEYGFQAWVGGQCVYCILLSWDPTLEQHVPNTIPADTGMTSAQFVAYVIFSVASLPLLWIQPHRIQKLFNVSSVVTLVFFVVLLIWALATMGPEGFGSTLGSKTELPLTGEPYSVVWLMISGIMTTIGSIAAGILNQNDFARLAKRPAHAIWGQALSFPIYSIFASVLGILVTAATQNRLGGEAVWNPPTLIAKLLEINGSAGTRAAVFFAGLALTISQIGANIPGNALAGGIDLAALFPRYINVRRGAYITALLSPIVNPWRLVNTATTFLVVLSGYSVFLAPMTGMMAASYLLVNKQKLLTEDLYRGDSGSIYWYTAGINWRAPVSWIVGVAPCLPGFIAAVETSITVPDSVAEFYSLNYVYSFISSATCYTLLHRIFPANDVDAFVTGTPDANETIYQHHMRWDTASESSAAAQHFVPRDAESMKQSRGAVVH